VPIAVQFLRRVGAPRELTAFVGPLVERHLEHIRYTRTPTAGAIRRLAYSVCPATVEDIALLIEADHSGRPPLPAGPPDTGRRMLDAARRENVNNKMPPRLIEGRDVMPYYNDEPGPHVGVDVTAAYNAWLDGRYSTADEARVWLDGYMRNRASHLRGEHVLPYFDGVGGRHVGEVLDLAWTQQRAGMITDEASALAWLAGYMAERSNNEQDTGVNAARNHSPAVVSAE
jgi:hypothetical protein